MSPIHSLLISLALLSPPAPVPASLQPPAGHEIAFRFEATGVQIYDCTGGTWVFRAPEATLFNEGGKPRGSHYAGPTWESTGGRVTAVREGGVPIDPTAIPWLLLRAVSWTGRGKMTDVTYIQRLNTTGGLAPSSGCDAGAEARVDYTATYVFFSREDHGE